jgi:hypothetical protein
MAVWTKEDDEQLRAMAVRGASAARVAASLKRKMHAVRARARLLGCPLPTISSQRKNVPKPTSFG